MPALCGLAPSVRHAPTRAHPPGRAAGQQWPMHKSQPQPRLTAGSQRGQRRWRVCPTHTGCAPPPPLHPSPQPPHRQGRRAPGRRGRSLWQGQVGTAARRSGDGGAVRCKQLLPSGATPHLLARACCRHMTATAAIQSERMDDVRGSLPSPRLPHQCCQQSGGARCAAAASPAAPALGLRAPSGQCQQTEAEPLPQPPTPANWNHKMMW